MTKNHLGLAFSQLYHIMVIHHSFIYTCKCSWDFMKNTKMKMSQHRIFYHQTVNLLIHTKHYWQVQSNILQLVAVFDNPQVLTYAWYIFNHCIYVWALLHQVEVWCHPLSVHLHCTHSMQVIPVLLGQISEYHSLILCTLCIFIGWWRQKKHVPISSLDIACTSMWKEMGDTPNKENYMAT